MEKFGKFMAILLAMIISPIITGFIFTQLWLWFIVPTFHLQPLRIVEAIGIMFLFNYVTTKPKKEAEQNFWTAFKFNMAFIVVAAVFVLLVGYIVSLFM